MADPLIDEKANQARDAQPTSGGADHDVAANGHAHHHDGLLAAFDHAPLKQEKAVLDENGAAYKLSADYNVQGGKPEFEERLFYATLQRRTYGMHTGDTAAPKERWFHWFENRFGPDVHDNPLLSDNREGDKLDWETATRADLLTDFDKEKARAKRMLRVAGWLSAFYLMTTDVIGPFNAPFAFSTLGFVPGVLLYLVFGVAAYYSSWIVLNLYLRLDSDRYPIKNFGDLMNCFFGKIGHYYTASIQVLQLYIICAINILGASQSFTLVDDGNVCFVVGIVIFTCIPFVISLPFKNLRLLSWICSLSVFVNLIIVFTSMGFIAHSPPNFDAAANAYGFTPPYAPIQTQAVVSNGLANSVNGAMNMVYGWSGIVIFIEFMNEMRRPCDFWKSFSCGELLVFLVYIVYGTYVYAFQGQYTLPLAYQGVGNRNWANVGNGLSLWTQVVAAVLYLNIGMKVVYWWIFEDLTNGPPINSRRGWIIWLIMNCISYPIAFVIATAIPQIQTLQGIVGAALLLQFSYTLPPLMQLAYDVMADASKDDGVYVPGQLVQRADSWKSMSRWRRGLFTGRVYFKAINLTYTLAGFAVLGLGCWGSIETIINVFKTGAATSFGCTPPV